MQHIGAEVQRLADQNRVNVEKLSEMDSFVDAAVQATIAALRTSEEEKRAALAAAVLNSALPDAPDRTEQQIFIRTVDELTTWHLRILAFFRASPEAQAVRDSSAPGLITGGAADILVGHYNELGRRDDLVRQIWQDLFTRGLVSSNSLHVTSSSAGMRASRTSQFGERFLKFVTAPD